MLRFSGLEEVVDIAPNTLSNRLEELTEIGLLTRNAFNEIPPRVEYNATEKARDHALVFGISVFGLSVMTSNQYQPKANKSDSPVKDIAGY